MRRGFRNLFGPAVDCVQLLSHVRDVRGRGRKVAELFSSSLLVIYFMFFFCLRSLAFVFVFPLKCIDNVSVCAL
jgi:hypothetical protein